MFISIEQKVSVQCNMLVSPSHSLSSVPSQPPQNVRAISVTSDEAVITWAEPPRLTLHGVLKGYRIVFWAVFPDGGELISAFEPKEPPAWSVRLEYPAALF